MRLAAERHVQLAVLHSLLLSETCGMRAGSIASVYACMAGSCSCRAAPILCLQLCFELCNYGGITVYVCCGSGGWAALTISCSTWGQMALTGFAFDTDLFVKVEHLSAGW